MFNDRRELDATVVGSDERTDVALLKVNGTNFPSLRAGNVDQLRVGEPVLAIGSPFGFDYSASAGIVSAKMRNMMGETSVPFIQTDVALNPGISGGLVQYISCQSIPNNTKSTIESVLPQNRICDTFETFR